MAITLTEIITVDEYIEVYPQDANVEEDLIQSAINRATITLDAICGGLIATCWPISNPQDPAYDPTSTYFRTTEEINYIKQAHAIQAQYNVSRNLDMSAGTESYTSGSNNYNETRPRADMVADEIIYQLLAKGRVYNPNITSNTTIKNVGGVQDGFYDPSYDPGDEYVTYNVGDLRYVKANNTLYANKYAKWDGNGNIVADEIKVSTTGTSSAIANFITIGGLEWAFPNSSGTKWGSIEGILTDQTDLINYLNNNYYSKYNYVEGTEDKTTLNVEQIAELIGAAGGIYLGSQQGTLQDVSSDENASKFIGDYLGVSTQITKNSYFYITIATNEDWGVDIYKYIATGNKIDIGGTQYYEYKFAFKFTGDLSLLKQQVEANTRAIAQEVVDRTNADTQLQNQITAIKDALFPINSIYTTFTNTNPATLLGFGTWESIGTTLIPSLASVSVSGSGSTTIPALNVVGNGFTLSAVADTSSSAALYGWYAYNSGDTHFNTLYTDKYGTTPGSSGARGSQPKNLSIGVPTASQLGFSSLYKSGLTTVEKSTTLTLSGLSGTMTTNQVYMWKRTA